EYDVTLAVADIDGNVTEEATTVMLDERSPPPSVDRFEVGAEEFLDQPGVAVKWAVSDEGGELEELLLELRRADGEVADSASPMVRDAEATGEDRLSDRDGDGTGEYEVTLRVTDYFEQTAEESEQIALDG
ncbi:MAG: hypothetical protein M8354_03635, partial [Halalkalicoccus sp.]|nr:hypothetical protein [Halalkalicoccus sp.]